MQQDEIVTLARDAWVLHTAAGAEPWLVKPSAPVLYFGDLEAFRPSPLRVATVALNPSRREFPAPDSFERFPGADSGDQYDYLDALGAYFTQRPYSSWFDFFEQTLLGMNTSYYPGQESVALHTDIGSVLPTDPTWSGLAVDIREKLARDGVPLWHRLIEAVRPHVVLWSTARAWLDYLTLSPLTPWQPVVAFASTQSGKARRRPIVIEGRWFEVPGAEPLFVAFGPASQKPLGNLSHAQKREAGVAIREAWSHGPR